MIKTRDIQVGFIDRRHFFSNLDRAEPDPANKALYLIDLCAEGAFVPGPNLDNAKQAIDTWITSDAFMPNYLNGRDRSCRTVNENHHTQAEA